MAGLVIPPVTPSPGPRVPPLCHAPWTSLHLDPLGWATACTANKRDPLGNVAGRSLLEIWTGPAAEGFRASFEDAGLAPGCDVCRWQHASSGTETMYARIYDYLPVPHPDVWPHHIEFTLSTECNLECVMCNGSFSSTIRRRREGLAAQRSPYDDAFFEQLPPFLDHLRTAKFLGGEPFLSRENHRVWDLMARSSNHPTCHVTTNGTVFTRHTEEALDAVSMSFAVSMDGCTAATVEHIRRGARLIDILANLDRFQAHVDRHGTDLSLTFCLMTENWHELADFLVFGERRGLSVYVNTVLSPSRFSLYHLAPNDLAEIVSQLSVQDRRMEATLDLNLAIWRDQLSRLRHATSGPAINAGVPVHFPALRAPSSTRLDAPLSATEAERALRDWTTDRAVATVDVDPSGTIASAEMGGISTIHLDRLVGCGIDEVFVWLQSAFGRLDTSTATVHRPDAGDRVIRFDDGVQATEVRLVSGAHPDGGAWWRVASRPFRETSGAEQPPA